jgi:hypothetical protein
MQSDRSDLHSAICNRMKHLFSPWRSAYINRKQPPGCFLCRAKEQKRDKANLLLFRGEQSFIIMNRFPYNNGHLLIAPYRHTGDIQVHADARRHQGHQRSAGKYLAPPQPLVQGVVSSEQ